MKKKEIFLIFCWLPNIRKFHFGKTTFDNTIQVLIALLLDSFSHLWTASGLIPYFTESLLNTEDISQIRMNDMSHHKVFFKD